MQAFDIRTVREKDVALIREMYKGDVWMSAENVTRHKGIAVESSFSLSMYRWVNKIIDFVKVSQELNKIGIKEIEIKIEHLKTMKVSLTALLTASNNGQYMVFRRLKAN